MSAAPFITLIALLAAPGAAFVNTATSTSEVVVATDGGLTQSRSGQMRFAAMDRNNDGIITRDEWRGSARSFDVHDWNGDGVLADDEVRIGAQRNTDIQYADHDPSRAERYLSWTDAGFANLDHNRDRRITTDEWHYDRETFLRADRNRDGSLTRAEFLGGDMDDDRGDQFEYLDANNNGRIERAEWHGSNDAFAWLDQNRDGVLSRLEVAGSDDPARPIDQFASLDVDGDGTISRDEWHWSRVSFNDRDLNRDGVISRREFVVTADDGGARPTPGGTVGVNSQHRWTDTGLSVRAGDVLTFQASGRIQMSTNPDDVATPAGATSGRSAPEAPIQNATAGALIARIGDSAPILIGDRRTITAPVGGRLYLGVNDDHLPDNTGEFHVTVEARGRTTR